MCRFYVYPESMGKPIYKTKHENEAMLFVSDFKNLQRYGCMSIIREDTEGSRCQWNADDKAWIAMEGING